MIATLQQQSCYAGVFSDFANYASMTGLESDQQLIKALVEYTRLSPSGLAVKLGVAATTILRPFKGTATTRISQPTLDKIRTRFPDFPGFEKDADLPDAPAGRAYLPVAILPSFAGMGGGGTGDGDEEYAMISRSLIEDELRGRADDFQVIDVRGDSMEPDFRHGDQILVDKRDRDPRQPGAFALFDGDGYVLKLVERIPQRRGWYRIFSVNGRYSEYEIEEQEATIMGRPVWFARRL